MGSAARMVYDWEMVPSYIRGILRSYRLRCPICGQGRLFRGWFAMNERCEGCGLKYNRAPGYFLGSIYINYGLTAVLVTIGYFGMYFGTDVDPTEILWWMVALSVIFPACFFRYARSLWMAIDMFWDPPSDEETPTRQDNQQ